MGEAGQSEAAGTGSRGTTDFLFVAGVPALDLVNTEIMVRGKRRDLLATPRDVARWWQAARRHHPEMAEVQGRPAYDRALLEALLHLRSALRGIFSAVAEGGDPREEDVDRVNAVLSTGHHALERASGGALTGVYRTGGTTGSAAILLPLALSAFHLLTEGNLARLHRCENERCILLLYDTTRSATRRWCSVGCKDRDRKMKRYHHSHA